MSAYRPLTALAAVAVATVGIAVASPAAAFIIFQDNFNRANNNVVGNGWSELENDANDVAISSNALRLRDFRLLIIPFPPFVINLDDAAAGQLGGFSTIGLTNIKLSYDWAPLTAADSNDELLVQWKLASQSSWITLATHTLGGAGGVFTSNMVNLGLAAENVTDLQIRFLTDARLSSIFDHVHDDGALVDNVTLVGLSAPSHMVALCLGLILLAGLRNRRHGEA